MLVGIGFAVAGEVTGANELTPENQRLRGESLILTAERNALLETIAIERDEHAGRADRYLVAIGRLEFQNKMTIESLWSNLPVTSVLGPWPREEQATCLRR